MEATSTNSDAHGMFADGNDNDLSNSGDITVTATNTDAHDYATAYGMQAYGDVTNTLTNEEGGEITVTATAANSLAEAYGMLVSGTSTLNNYGTIEVTAKGYAARGYGMSAAEDTNTLTNSGSITVKTTSAGTDAFAEAYGMWADGDTNDLTNDGNITVTATADKIAAEAYGMWADGDTNTFTNSDTIKVEAKGTGDANARAYGMWTDVYSDADFTNTFTNSGTINVTATSESEFAGAYGMWAIGNKNDLTNSGTIDVTATSNAAEAYAEAFGMVSLRGISTLTNDGTMTVTATGEDTVAYGMVADGSAENDLINNGTIDVTATGDTEAVAYGMAADGDSVLNNYGTINASATGVNAKAYQAYIYDGTANIGTWTLELKEAYGNNYVFGVVDDAKVIFGLTKDDKGNAITNEGATLVITNAEDNVSKNPYSVKDLVALEDGATEDNVSGYIGKVEPVAKYDFIEWSIVNEDGTPYDLASTPTWEDQYISTEVSATEDNSPTQLATEQHIGSMSANLNQLRNIVANQTRTVGEGLDFGKMEVASENTSPTANFYADADTTVSDASYVAPDAPLWKVFAMPYYSQSGANNNAYDAHMYGIAMGVTRDVTDDFSLGVHAGFSKGEGDSDLTDSDSTAYTFGMHAVYNMGKSLFFRGQLSGFIGENELDMIGSPDGITRANADMDTNGVYAMLAAGYDIPLAAQHIITPELAVSYFYAHMDGFDTYFYNAGVKDAAFGMENESYDAWYADATVRWTGVFSVGESMLKPTAKIGVRQALSDPEIASTMKFGTTATTTYSDANKTAFICETGLAWEVDDITLSATYTGEFGDEEYSHMGMFKVDWAF